MKFLKQISMLSFLAVAATAASAANQPFVAGSGSVTLDTSYLSANGYTVTALGSSTYNATTGVLTDPLQTISTATNPGALKIDFSDTSGLTLKKGLTSVKLFDFSFDVATQSLFGTITSGIFLNLPNQSLLTATTLAGDFGGSALDNVANSSTARKLNLVASDFVLSEAFKGFLTENGIDPTAVSFVASLVKTVNIGTVSTPGVPEPSTYALMGVGLVGIAMARRSRRQA